MSNRSEAEAALQKAIDSLKALLGTHTDLPHYIGTEFEETGEVRAPEVGEWFASSEVGRPLKNDGEFYEKDVRRILRKKVEPKPERDMCTCGHPKHDKECPMPMVSGGPCWCTERTKPTQPAFTCRVCGGHEYAGNSYHFYSCVTCGVMFTDKDKFSKKEGV